MATIRVIAVHGAAVNGATWIPLREALGDRAAVIADDLPGHGTRRGEPFAFAAAVDEIVASARRNGPGSILTGDSLGGYLALAAAARLGDEIAGVVAGSCTFAMRGLAGLAARASLVPGALVPGSALRALLDRACGAELARCIAERGLAPEMRNRTLRALVGRDVLADVRAVRVPIAFVVGALDVPIVWNAARFARSAVAGTVLVEAAAPHGVGLLRPRRFAETIVALHAAAAEAAHERRAG